MDITPPIPARRRLIQGYGGGAFRISGSVHPGSVIVFPEDVMAWPVAALAEVTEASFASVFAVPASVELLLIGCGPRLAPLAPEALAALRRAGIRAELMDTGAACRTYNVLMAEDRRIAAALIAV